MPNNKTNGELRKRLAAIRNEDDFVKILDQEFGFFFGSLRRCAEELKKLAPKGKQEIIARAMRHEARYNKNWNFAGD